jgi:uncharacterized membrane protein
VSAIEGAQRPVAIGAGFERRIGRLLIVVTYVAVGLLLVGVVLMVVSGISPLAGGPRLDPTTLVGDVVALRPAGFLWLGLIAVIATPVSRVIAAAIGFARRGEPVMALISLAILVVIAVGIAAALVTEA